MIIARTWKQPKCPLTDAWIKMQYIYTMEYYLAIKRNEIGSFVETWMDLETVIQSEVRQKQKNKYRVLMNTCRIQNNGMDAKHSICKAETETQMQRINVQTSRQKRGSGMNWETGIDIYTLLCIKQITNQNLLYSTGNSTQCSMVT